MLCEINEKIRNSHIRTEQTFIELRSINDPDNLNDLDNL